MHSDSARVSGEVKIPDLIEQLFACEYLTGMDCKEVL